MANTHANLVLGANHAQRLLAAHLGTLDGKFLVAIIEFGSQSGDDHFLPCGDIGGTAHDLHGVITVSKIDCSDVQVVAIRMIYAGNYLSHNQSS